MKPKLMDEKDVQIEWLEERLARALETRKGVDDVIFLLASWLKHVIEGAEIDALISEEFLFTSYPDEVELIRAATEIVESRMMKEVKR